MALKQRDNRELRVTQFLSPAAGLVTNANFMYANKVAIISLNERRPTGVLIEDEGIRRTMEVFFESLWRESGGT